MKIYLCFLIMFLCSNTLFVLASGGLSESILKLKTKSNVLSEGNTENHAIVKREETERRPGRFFSNLFRLFRRNHRPRRMSRHRRTSNNLNRPQQQTNSQPIRRNQINRNNNSQRIMTNYKNPNSIRNIQTNKGKIPKNERKNYDQRNNNINNNRVNRKNEERQKRKNQEDPFNKISNKIDGTTKNKSENKKSLRNSLESKTGKLNFNKSKRKSVGKKEQTEDRDIQNSKKAESSISTINNGKFQKEDNNDNNQFKNSFNNQLKKNIKKEFQNNAKVEKRKRKLLNKKTKFNKRNSKTTIISKFGKKGNNVTKGKELCGNQNFCASCVEEKEMEREAINYIDFLKKNPQSRNKCFVKKDQNPIDLNDKRYQHCFIYKNNTHGFYTYQEALHSYAMILHKQGRCKVNKKVLEKAIKSAIEDTLKKLKINS